MIAILLKLGGMYFRWLGQMTVWQGNLLLKHWEITLIVAIGGWWGIVTAGSKLGTFPALVSMAAISVFACWLTDKIHGVIDQVAYDLFPCPHCKVGLKVPKGNPGSKSLCPSCQGVVVAPGEPDPNRIHYLCPCCKSSAWSLKEHVGVTAPCGACGQEITVPAA